MCSSSSSSSPCKSKVGESRKNIATRILREEGREGDESIVVESLLHDKQ